MNYRPKNWEAIASEFCPVMEQYDPDPMIADKSFEAGADAILEALKKSAVTMSNHNPTNRTVMETAIFLNQCENGWLVFLPD